MNFNIVSCSCRILKRHKRAPSKCLKIIAQDNVLYNNHDNDRKTEGKVWLNGAQEETLLEVNAPCVYLARLLPLKTSAFAVKMPVHLPKQGKEANKNFLVAQLQSLWLSPLLK